MKTLEPVAVINSLVTLVEAAIALAVGFGLKWTAEQVSLVMALVVATTNLLKTMWARSQVTPVANPRNSANKRFQRKTAGRTGGLTSLSGRSA